MTQNGKTLSMHNKAIWKGTFDDNGMLLKIHENAYTIGYSALLSPDGTSAGKVKFGDGVFYDARQKNNKVYVGAPTVSSAVPVFAGIMVREPGIASGYPAINDEVADFQKGMLCKEGYVEYKKAFVVGSSPSALPSEKSSTFDNTTIGYAMIVSASDGAVYFAPTTSDKVDNDDVVAGKVVAINPDDKTVTVYVSPAIYA
jgi:hypothetical protein